MLFIIFFTVVIRILTPILSSAVDQCRLPSKLANEIRGYKPVADRIIKLVQEEYKGRLYHHFADFIAKYHKRLTGSEGLEQSYTYVGNLMQEYYLENIHSELGIATRWDRRRQEIIFVSHQNRSLEVIATGNSIPTDDEGLEAEAIVVRSFKELYIQNISSSIEGKIVIYNQPWMGYAESVKYRKFGAIEAAKLGAVAVLVRSITPLSLNTLHAGNNRYSEKIPKIPVGIVAHKNVNMFQRFQDRGKKIILRLILKTVLLTSTVEPSVTNFKNIIAEYIGGAHPHKVVGLYGHLDSWDVGDGVLDAGGGAFVNWFAVAILRQLNLRPKRTIRTVLLSGAEQGFGKNVYERAHRTELSNDFVFVLEPDRGTFTPLGLEFATGPKGGCMVKEIVKLLAPIGADLALRSEGSVGSIIDDWTTDLLPGAILLNTNQRYFWYYHSVGDALSIITPGDLDKCAAVMSVAAYVIANLTEDFPTRSVDQFYSSGFIISLNFKILVFPYFFLVVIIIL